MQVQFLGTSAGAPTKERNVSATALIESKGKSWYLVDCGEGTQHQLLRTKLSVNDLCGVFITHIHGDHCYGLPGLLASASLNGRIKPLTIVAPKGIAEWFAATQAFTMMNLSYELDFVAAETLTDTVFGQFVVSKVALSHRIPSYAYVFIERSTLVRLDTDKLEMLGIPRSHLWGQLQSGNSIEFEGKTITSDEVSLPLAQPRKVIISGDNDKPELLKAACEYCDLLIHEATFIQAIGDKAGDTGHTTAKQIGLFAQAMHLPNLILTHFSGRYQSRADSDSPISLIEDETKQYYKGQLFLAEDFARYQLSKEKMLSLIKE